VWNGVELFLSLEKKKCPRWQIQCSDNKIDYKL
jgi:hypothetical protein